MVVRLILRKLQVEGSANWMSCPQQPQEFPIAARAAAVHGCAQGMFDDGDDEERGGCDNPRARARHSVRLCSTLGVNVFYVLCARRRGRLSTTLLDTTILLDTTPSTRTSSSYWFDTAILLDDYITATTHQNALHVH